MRAWQRSCVKETIDQLETDNVGSNPEDLIVLVIAPVVGPRITNNSQEHKLVKIHYRHLTSLNQTSGLRNAGEAGQRERTGERI